MLPAECLELLTPSAGETILDCTAGLGGHATILAREVGVKGTLILNDLDPGNLASAEENVRDVLGDACPEVVTIHGPFDRARLRLAERGLAADCVLADLGFASVQVDDPDRGLSFKNDGPLDMRLDPTSGPTAADLVAELNAQDLADVLYQFGEERLSRRIARKVVEERASGPITTTSQLAEIVRSAVPKPRGKVRIDPATRTFQALRIAVNDEIGCLERLLGAVRREAERHCAGTESEAGGGWLRDGARVAVIAFHSLEDRPVKLAFREMASEGIATALTKKPVRPTENEVAANPRSRSARLRAVRLGRDGV